MTNQDVHIREQMTESFEMTVGDLVEAITEIASKAGRTQEECYKLASSTIEKLLREKKQRELLS